MTAKSLSQLSTDIDVQLPTNNLGQIHADMLRNVLKDIINNEYVPVGNILTNVGTPGDTTFLRGDGSWQTLVGGGGGGGGSAYRYISGTSSANVGDICYCDTSSAGFVLTLPTSPVTGSGVSIRDARGTWTGQNLVLDPGSANKIAGNLGTFACNVADANFDLVWRGSTIGWEPEFIIANLARGGGGIGIGNASGQAIVTGRAGSSGAGAGPAIFWSTTDKSTTITVSGGGLIAATNVSTGGEHIIRGTAEAPILPAYFEITGAAGNIGFGVANKAFPLDGQYLGQGGINAFGWFNSAYAEGPGQAASVGSGNYINTDICGIRYNGSQVTIYKNGTSLGTFTAPTSTPPGGVGTGIFPAAGIAGATGTTITANFGATALAHLPAGSHSWDGSQSA